MLVRHLPPRRRWFPCSNDPLLQQAIIKVCCYESLLPQLTISHLKLKEHRIPRKGWLRGCYLSKTHCLFGTVMLPVTLHVLKLLPDTSKRIPPVSNTCSTFTPLFCSPEAVVSTLLFPFSLLPLPSCIYLSLIGYKRSFLMAWQGTWNCQGQRVGTGVLLPPLQADGVSSPQVWADQMLASPA